MYARSHQDGDHPCNCIPINLSSRRQAPSLQTDDYDNKNTELSDQGPGSFPGRFACGPT